MGSNISFLLEPRLEIILLYPGLCFLDQVKRASGPSKKLSKGRNEQKSWLLNSSGTNEFHVSETGETIDPTTRGLAKELVKRWLILMFGWPILFFSIFALVTYLSPRKYILTKGIDLFAYHRCQSF